MSNVYYCFRFGVENRLKRRGMVVFGHYEKMYIKLRPAPLGYVEVSVPVENKQIIERISSKKDLFSEKVDFEYSNGFLLIEFWGGSISEERYQKFLSVINYFVRLINAGALENTGYLQKKSFEMIGNNDCLQFVRKEDVRDVLRSSLLQKIVLFLFFGICLVFIGLRLVARHVNIDPIVKLDYTSDIYCVIIIAGIFFLTVFLCPPLFRSIAYLTSKKYLSYAFFYFISSIIFLLFFHTFRLFLTFF